MEFRTEGYGNYRDGGRGGRTLPFTACFPSESITFNTWDFAEEELSGRAMETQP
jgi:hypothetical protein